MESAAAAAGIGRSTLYEWLQRGEDGDPKFSEFSDLIKKAQAEAEMTAVR